MGDHFLSSNPYLATRRSGVTRPRLKRMAQVRVHRQYTSNLLMSMFTVLNQVMTPFPRPLQYVDYASYCLQSSIENGRVWFAWPSWSPDLLPLDFFFGAMWRVSCTPLKLTPEMNWLCEHTLLLNKFNTELKCSTESDNHCYDGVMNVIKFRVDALNIFSTLSANVLEQINE
jgi:hypothetical protein